MRIVETDNFNGDYPDESFLIPKGFTKKEAEDIAEIMNTRCSSPEASRYWKVVEDDYKLQPGFEP